MLSSLATEEGWARVVLKAKDVNPEYVEKAEKIAARFGHEDYDIHAYIGLVLACKENFGYVGKKMQGPKMIQVTSEGAPVNVDDLLKDITEAEYIDRIASTTRGPQNQKEVLESIMHNRKSFLAKGGKKENLFNPKTCYGIITMLKRMRENERIQKLYEAAVKYYEINGLFDEAEKIASFVEDKKQATVYKAVSRLCGVSSRIPLAEPQIRSIPMIHPGVPELKQRAAELGYSYKDMGHIIKHYEQDLRQLEQGDSEGNKAKIGRILDDLEQNPEPLKKLIDKNSTDKK